MMDDLQIRTRSALAEIPFRMTMLRVSTDDFPTTFNNPLINSPTIDTNNIPQSFLTPSSTPPDEIIIRQRGIFWQSKTKN